LKNPPQNPPPLSGVEPPLRPGRDQISPGRGNTAHPVEPWPREGARRIAVAPAQKRHGHHTDGDETVWGLRWRGPGNPSRTVVDALKRPVPWGARPLNCLGGMRSTRSPVGAA